MTDMCERCGHGPHRPPCGHADADAVTAVALAADADALAGRVRRFHGLLAQDVRGHGFRLGDVAGLLERVARDLNRTADDIARHRNIPADSCQSEFAGCPEHGHTVTSVGRSFWCFVGGCRQQWDYDRVSFPCDQPRAYRVTDPMGGTRLACVGHAWPVRAWESWTVELLDDPTGTPSPTRADSA
ncbi:hypothetical protein [Nonomuraea sp. NPDC049646]|uniref:hypothetical protein n=1 Tax=unclassified Nonomuraea TaxID=2593643 RepID=UPI0037B54AD4